MATIYTNLHLLYQAQGNEVEAQKYAQKYKEIETYLAANKTIVARTEAKSDNKLVEQFYVFHLAASTDPSLLNRLIKPLWGDKDAQETSAALIQALSKEERKSYVIL